MKSSPAERMDDGGWDLTCMTVDDKKNHQLSFKVLSAAASKRLFSLQLTTLPCAAPRIVMMSTRLSFPSSLASTTSSASSIAASSRSSISSWWCAHLWGRQGAQCPHFTIGHQVSYVGSQEEQQDIEVVQWAAQSPAVEEVKGREDLVDRYKGGVPDKEANQAEEDDRSQQDINGTIGHAYHLENQLANHFTLNQFRNPVLISQHSSADKAAELVLQEGGEVEVGQVETGSCHEGQKEEAPQEKHANKEIGVLFAPQFGLKCERVLCVLTHINDALGHSNGAVVRIVQFVNYEKQVGAQCWHDELAPEQSRQTELLTQGDLAGEGHAHQHERQAHRHKLDDLVQRKLQLQVAEPVQPRAALQQGVRQHGLGRDLGDGHFELLPSDKKK
ncbi:hypothetical protein F7725_007388, partial [Dissostichus mawsoni]